MIPDCGSGAGRGAGMGVFPPFPRLQPPSSRSSLPEQGGMGALERTRSPDPAGTPAAPPRREQDGTGGWGVSLGQVLGPELLPCPPCPAG